MKENNEQYYIVPKTLLDRILENANQILMKQNSETYYGIQRLPADYISESQAKVMLDKKTTWFWKMRKDGFLPSSKVGGKNYYRMKDIQHLLDSAFNGNLK